MNNSYETILIQLLKTKLLVILLCIFQFQSYAQSAPLKKQPKSKATVVTDTLKPSIKDTASKLKTASNSTINSDTVKRINVIDTLLISKDSLTSVVDYGAEDSAILIMSSQKFYLYGKANVEQDDVKLSAHTISFNQANQLVTAYGTKDSTSNDLYEKPTITQGGSKSINDTIFFNLKSQKGLLKNSFYQEGDMFVNATVLKKVNKDVAYGFRSSFTTCNLDEPHFNLRTKKVKIINNKIAVTGPAYPEFEGVPMPIAIPFGIFPLSQGRQSGLLPPQFATNQSFGIGLEGLGYYKVVNDNLDLTVRTNIYSYGGWNLNINPKYYKRYRYNGNFDLSIQRSRILNSGFITVSPNSVKNQFTEGRSFNIRWGHTTDSKARPGTTFGASVNAGSTKFNSLVPNNANRNVQNMLTSTINYGKSWNQGKYNLTVGANHNQNNNLGLVNLQIPTVTFNMTTVYPFEQKERIGESKWYEKLGISYSGTLQTQASFYDSSITFARILDTTQWGAQHSVPISLALPSLGPIIVTPGISFSERWYGQQLLLKWNSTTEKVDTVTNKGYFRASEVSFNLATSTRIFGTYNFRKGNVKAIRHEIKPFISANYKPDFARKYHYDLQVDTSGRKARVSKYNGMIGGSYSEGAFGGLSFGIDNLLEMKVVDKTDSTGKETKKVKLIDGLSIAGSYNFFADSLQLSPISINFRSTLMEKINITGGATINPYETNAFGQSINKLKLPGRFTNANLAVNTSLQSKKTDEKKDKDRVPRDNTMTPEEQQRQLEFVRQNPAEFVDFNIPWSIQIQFALNYNRIVKTDFTGFRDDISANLNLNGDFSLTPKWKVGGSTFYNFQQAKLQNVTMFLSREMHCWQMSVNLNLGQFKSFAITINPKSGILRDLKINRSRSFFEF